MVVYHSTLLQNQDEKNNYIIQGNAGKKLETAMWSTSCFNMLLKGSHRHLGHRSHHVAGEFRRQGTQVWYEPQPFRWTSGKGSWQPPQWWECWWWPPPRPQWLLEVWHWMMVMSYDMYHSFKLFFTDTTLYQLIGSWSCVFLPQFFFGTSWVVPKILPPASSAQAATAWDARTSSRERGIISRPAAGGTHPAAECPRKHLSRAGSKTQCVSWRGCWQKLGEHFI